MYPLLNWIYEKIFSHFPRPVKKLYLWCLDLYARGEEMWDYLVFGAFAFIVNMVAYVASAKLLHIQYLVSTAIAWVAAVLFAYWTNRKYVFKSQVQDKKGLWKEFCSFIGCRLFSGFLQFATVYVVVDWLQGNDVFGNFLGNVVAIIANYILSKLIIFRKKEG